MMPDAVHASTAVADRPEFEQFEQDALQMEALLLARTYLYELMGKLLGGTPDEKVLAIAVSSTTQDVVEEFAGASDELAAFAEFLEGLRGRDFGRLLEGSRSEHTRIFVGPAALPASPYESPYVGNHDMALFQENTLEVRHAYEDAGLRPRRVQAVPDDHVAMMCSFMAAMSQRSLDSFLRGDAAALEGSLERQLSFSEAHMGQWLDVFAASVRNSKAGSAAVFYPQFLEAASAFAKSDRAFLTEAAFWASNQEPFERREPAMVLADASETLGRIRDASPLGASDFEMVSIEK